MQTEQFNHNPESNSHPIIYVTKLITLLLIPGVFFMPLSLAAQKKDASIRALLKEFQKSKAESRRVFENLLEENDKLSSENRRLFIELEDTTHNLKLSQESIAEYVREIEELKNEIEVLKSNPSDHAIQDFESVAMLRPSDLDNELSVPSSGSKPVVNINTASENELRLVPGIGPVLAERIMENRPYQEISDLLKVDGIGEKRLENLSPYLTLR